MPHENPCGSGLARDAGNAPLQADRSDAIAGKPRSHTTSPITSHAVKQSNFSYARVRLLLVGRMARACRKMLAT
ncbi:hypothetical protein C7A07_13760 [Pseudomonas fragi]|nr:hypothetical protein [Pseudomonas fragi]PRW97898.1 hypothetical protein C7A07_13760 [Pseudomonas fragi]